MQPKSRTRRPARRPEPSTARGLLPPALRRALALLATLGVLAACQSSAPPPAAPAASGAAPAAAPAAAPPAAARPAPIALQASGFGPSIGTVVTPLGKQLGFYAEEGLDLEWVVM